MQDPTTNTTDADRSPDMRAMVERTFKTISAKDLKGSVALFGEAGEMTDPHFPIPHMRGKAAIEQGLGWAFGTMREMNFEITHYFPASDSDPHGQQAAVEVASKHILASTGQTLNFPQVFIFESHNGLITRLQAYEPYGPGGVVGFFLDLNRFITRVKWNRLKTK